MSSVEFGILAVFECLMMIGIAYALLGKVRLSVGKLLILLSVVAAFVIISNEFIVDPVISLIVRTLFNVLWVKFFFSIKKLNEVLLIFAITTILGIVIQLSAAVIVQLIDSNFEMNFIYGVISQSLSLIIVLLVVKFAPLKSLYGFIKDRNILFGIIIINVYLVYFFITLWWYIGSDDIVNTFSSMLVIIMITLAINTVLSKEGLLNQSNENQLQTYKRYLPIVETLIAEIREKQHDYHNQVQSVISLYENAGIREDKAINAYLDDLKGDEVLAYLLKLKNQILMALLYSKYTSAKQNNVEMVFDIRCFDASSVYTDYELVEIFGILIDNAMDACLEWDRKRIEILIDRSETRNKLIIRNTSKAMTVSEVNDFFRFGYSSKGELHKGIGLHKLRKMLKKHKGTITASYDTQFEMMEFEVAFK